MILTYISSLSSRILGKKNKYIEWTFIGFTIVVFILVSGLRTNLGDTGFYMHSYENLKNFTGFTEDMGDKGFIIFQLILYSICSEPQFMVFITAMITQFINIYVLQKYKSYIELEIYMYFAAGYFLVTMNGIRQSFVASILFIATDLIVKGRFIPYFLVVMVLCSMHASAFIMIPAYFIVRQKAWSKSTLIVTGVASIFFLFFYQLIPLVLDTIGNNTYSAYEDSLLTPGSGSSFIRVIVASVPVILSYLYRVRINEIWKESNIFVNMSLLNLIVVIFGLYNWIFVRFSIYFQLYNFVLLPFIIKNCFISKKEQRLIYYLFMVCYFIFLYKEQVVDGLALGYRSIFYK